MGSLDIAQQSTLLETKAAAEAAKTAAETAAENGGGIQKAISAKISNAVSHSAPFSGTGKGKLIIFTRAGDANIYNLKIDGVALVTGTDRLYLVKPTTFEIEFSESFYVRTDSDLSGNYLACIAVFY